MGEDKYGNVGRSCRSKRIKDSERVVVIGWDIRVSSKRSYRRYSRSKNNKEGGDIWIFIMEEILGR